jgi:hypothetical protein
MPSHGVGPLSGWKKRNRSSSRCCPRQLDSCTATDMITRTIGPGAHPKGPVIGDERYSDLTFCIGGVAGEVRGAGLLHLAGAAACRICQQVGGLVTQIQQGTFSCLIARLAYEPTTQTRARPEHTEFFLDRYDRVRPSTAVIAWYRPDTGRGFHMGRHMGHIRCVGSDGRGWRNNAFPGLVAG